MSHKNIRSWEVDESKRFRKKMEIYVTILDNSMMITLIKINCKITWISTNKKGFSNELLTSCNWLLEIEVISQLKIDNINVFIITWIWKTLITP